MVGAAKQVHYEAISLKFVQKSEYSITVAEAERLKVELIDAIKKVVRLFGEGYEIKIQHSINNGETLFLLLYKETP